MSEYIIPDSKSVQEILAMLFGDGVKVDAADPIPIADGFVANYIFEEKTVAVCIADYHLVAYAGASMMMIPAGAAKDAATDKDVTPVMVESYYEVANILSKTMMDATSSHLKLAQLAQPSDDTSFAEPLTDGANEVSFSVELPGYGVGKLTFLIV